MHSIRENISPEQNSGRNDNLKVNSSYVDLPRISTKRRSKGSFSGKLPNSSFVGGSFISNRNFKKFGEIEPLHSAKTVITVRKPGGGSKLSLVKPPY